MKQLLKIIFSLAFLSFALASFASDFFPALPEAEIQRTVKVIDSSHYYDLNPHTASYATEAQWLTGLYEGLFSYDPVTLEPMNAICQNYKISRDKKRWTFTLRENVTFSDGTLITAETFRDAWIALLSNPNAPFSSMLDCVEGAVDFRMGKTDESSVRIETRGDYTLVVHLVQPTEHLPKLLCHHSLTAVSKTGGVYSGAFTLVSYDGKKMVLAKNEKYHDAENVFIPGIEVYQSDDSDENAYLFNTGLVDWISTMASVDKVLNKNSIHIAGEFGTSYIFFKIGNKPWDNPAFRNALIEAVPYDELRKKYSVPASTLVYPLAGYPDVSGISDYDAEDALKLMENARKEEKIPLNQSIPIVFAITDDEYIQEWVSLLRRAWEPLGVELITQSCPSSRYISSISTWNADLFSYSWIGDYADPLAFLELFRGDSSMNVASYKNSSFDELLSQSALASSSGEHYKLLSQAEQLLLDDGMIIPISHPVSLHVIDLNLVGGWQTNALDLHPLKYLYIKRTKTKLPNLVMAGGNNSCY